MKNHFKSAAKIILNLVFLSTLYACDNSSTETSSNNSSVAKTEMPSELQKLTLGAGTLSAYVTIDSNSPIAMTIDTTAGSESASATILGLTLDVHTVSITYEYDDGTGQGVLVVATASNTVDLTAGNGSIGFVAADYDLTSHDEDADGISNAAEFAAGSDPRVAGTAGASPCVLGSSQLGNCTL